MADEVLIFIINYFGCIDMLMQDIRPLIWTMFMGHRFTQFWFQNMFSGLQATLKNKGGARVDNQNCQV
jgi:hypothetical protein